MKLSTPWRAALAATALCAASARAEGERTYNLLRSTESWSFLDDAGLRGGDPFDAVKSRSLGGPWRLTFGGSTRLRYEMDRDMHLGTVTETRDDFGRLRQSLHLYIARGGAFRWFTEVSHADTFGSERMQGTRDENDADVQQLFFDFTAVPMTPHSVTFRLGRQEMSFGQERLVGVDDFANVRTSFDGLRIVARTRRTETSLFAMRPLVRFEHDMDEPNPDVAFAGLHAEFRPAARHVVQGYAMTLHDGTPSYEAEKTGDMGDTTRNTVGARYAYTHGGMVVEMEMAWQGGHQSDDSIRAGFGTVNASYQWRRAAWQPRLGFGVEMASGDADPYDGRNNTFRPLFGSTRTGLGHLGVIGRRNVQAARMEITTQPMRGMRWDSGVVVSQLDQARDAMYDQYGTSLSKNPAGAGQHLGWEVHSQVSYRFMTHHEVALEIARFWGDDMLDTPSTQAEATWGWVGYEFKF